MLLFILLETMKTKSHNAMSVQQLCRKLKIQLEQLAVTLEEPCLPVEEQSRRTKLMEQLKQQLAELS